MVGISHDYMNAWTGIDLDHGNPTDNAPVTLGLRMETAVDGRVMGVRFFRDLADSFEHVGLLIRDDDGLIVDVCHFHWNAADGSGADRWHSAYFRKPVRYAAGDRFIVAVYFAGGRYWSSTGVLTVTGIVNGNLTITQDGDGGSNGLYGYGVLQPTNTFGSSAYGVDVIFLEDEA